MSITERSILAMCLAACMAAAAHCNPREPVVMVEQSPKAGELSFGVDSGFLVTTLSRDDPFSFGVRAGAWVSWAPAALAGVSVGASAGVYGFRSLSDYFGPSRMWLAAGSIGYSFPLTLNEGARGVSMTAFGFEMSFGYYERVHEFLGISYSGHRLFTEAAARLIFVDGPVGSSIGLALLVPWESQPLPLVELGVRMGVWL
jgi:hypothetical protein